MLKNKQFLLLVVIICALLCPVISRAYDVSVLKSADIKPYNDAVEGFEKGCNCSIREFVLSGTTDALDEMLSSRPDLVLAVGLDALNKVQKIRNIPVVYTMVQNVPNFGTEARNISGIRMYIAPDRHIEEIVRVFPGVRRVGVIYDPKGMSGFIAEAEDAAREHDIELVLRKSNRPSDVPGLIDSLKDKIDLFWQIPDLTVINSESVKYLFLFSFRNNVPVFTFSKKYAELGAIASLHLDPFDIGQQTGELAKKIINDKTLTFPLRLNARRPLLVINKKLVRKMELRIPAEVIRRAVDVD